MIVSIGDRIGLGRFTRERVFERSAHFRSGSGERWLFLVSAELGNGPLNLVMAPDADHRGVDHVVVGEDVIELGGVQSWIVSRDRLEVFDSSMPAVASVRLGALDVFRRVVCADAPEKSLVALMDESRQGAFRGAFDRAFLEQARHGASLLAAGQWEEGGALLRGIGYGLTPSGDDFLAGFALGCRVNGREVDAREVCQAARRGNVLCDAFVGLAAEGRGSAAARRLVGALGNEESDEGAIESASRELMASGATSGADFAAGLWWALEHGEVRHGT